METEILSTNGPTETREAVRRAVQLLKAGDVVALPTETVYGLAANALDPGAVAMIFASKDRPSFDPLIVHIPHKSRLDEVAIIPEEYADVITALTDEFWPGPLTIVLPKTDAVPDIVTSGHPTVAVRVSADPIFKKIIGDFSQPIAAPSANRFGRISPTSASAVEGELGGKIPAIIDGGACNCGVESTIIRLAPPTHVGKKISIQILRHGPITPEELKKFGKIIPLEPSDNPATHDAPGQLPSHYAPSKPLRLLEKPEDFAPEPGKKYALLSYRGIEKDGFLNLHEWEKVSTLSPKAGKLPEAAVRLFFLLRDLDASDVDEIIAEPVPARGIGHAIRDRLQRASV